VNLTLYEITGTLQALADSLALCQTDEQRAECEAEIERTVAQQIHKVDSFCRFLAHLDSQAELAANEIDRLEARRRGLLHVQQSLERYAVRVMQSQNLKSIDGDTSRLSLRLNPPAVEILDEGLIPGKFKRIVQSVAIDKRQIKEAIQAGDSVPGADLHRGTALIRR